MKRVVRVSLWVGLVAICCGPWATAQNVTLTSAGGNVYDGIYLSPYYATVNGAPNTPIICDDFGDESYVPSSWTASITSFSSISPTNTAWDKQNAANASLYGAVGYLAGLVLSASTGSVDQVKYTFAMWAVFDPTGVETYLQTHPSTGGLISTSALCDYIFGASAGCTANPGTGELALAETHPTSQFGGYQVLSPYIKGTTTLCTAEAGNCPAQEFITVPEGGAALAYLLLAGLCCGIAVFSRSQRQIRGLA